MLDRDMRPTRFDLMLQYAREFVTEWFDQNPLGQIGMVGMRGGLGERVGEMSGMSTSSGFTCVHTCSLYDAVYVCNCRQPARCAQSYLRAP